MSGKRGAWLDRQGQGNAAAAISEVLTLQQQPGEQVHHVADELIEDSPYQARPPFIRESIEELAQGMREVGFQGVLIVRPHGEADKRRRGLFQLVYGHRRRAAWRLVCRERGELCQLPVVIREVSDERMLTIGAQENLQRQDLDPVEEAQLVAWHERVFFEKNQAQIGAMLGKSSDWVSVRSRVHRLPDALKERLQLRPRALSQMLELGTLYLSDPDEAIALADRVVQDNVSLDVLRGIIRGYTRPARRDQFAADRAGPSTEPIPTPFSQTAAQGNEVERRIADDSSLRFPGQVAARTIPREKGEDFVGETADFPRRELPKESMSTVPARKQAVSDLVLFQEAASALVSIAAHAHLLPANKQTSRALDQAEQALSMIRQAISGSK